VVVAPGVALTLVPLVALRPVAGDHAYVLAPLAVSVAVCCPAQIVPLVTPISGSGFTVTVAVVTAVQLPIVPVIV